MNIQNILLPQPFILINSIFFSLGLLYLCQSIFRFFLKKKYLNDNFPIYFIFFLAIISFFISYFLFIGFNYINISLKIFGVISSINGLIFFYKIRDKIFKFFYEISLDNIFIKIGLFSYFLIIFLPVTDADSLDYHLGAPLAWYENQSFVYFRNWLMFRQYGSGEIINYLGIANGIDNLNSCLNFIFLILMLMVSKKIFKKKNSQFIFSLVFLSIPINLFLFPSQKPMFYFIIAWLITFIYLFEKNSMDKKIIFIHFVNLSFITTSKLSFLIYTVPLWLFLLFNNNLKKEISLSNYVFSSIFIFIFFCFPIYFFNFQNYSNPISPIFDEFLVPIFGGVISPETINFSNFTRTYYGAVVNHWIEYLINFFVTLKPGKISTVFGISFILFFHKQIFTLFKNRNFLLLIFIIVLILISGQYQPRYYYASYILILFYLIKNLYQKKISILGLLAIKFQFVVIVSIMIIFTTINIFSIISDKSRHLTLSKHAYEYDENIWLNKKNVEGVIFTDLRTRIFMDNKNIFDQRFKYIDNEDYIAKEIDELIMNNKIDYVFYDNNIKNNSINKILKNLKNCADKENLETINFNYNVSRNPFNFKSNVREKVFFKINKKFCEK